MDQGVEVVMPTFLEFFASGLIHTNHSVKTNLARRDLTWLLSLLGRQILSNYLNEVHEVMKNYRRFHHHTDIEDIARNAQEILSLNHQYGEGWLIAKGAEKKMKEMYPQLNLLFLDADAGISEVNFFNRMHFFVNHTKAAAEMVAE